MNLPQPQLYRLILKPSAAYEATLQGSLKPGFTKPVSTICPKLYVVTRENDVHYVGVTNRPMASRLNMGLKAKGKGGYHGYKWKNLKSPLRLLVWSFPEESKPFLRQLETVEAEFAFLIRKDTGQWPQSQTEIHFYQASSAQLKAVAQMVEQCAT